MRWRSPSYSPPRRGYRSPPRGRYGRHRDSPCGLLVRNIPKDSRPEEVRSQFERFGRIRDVYLPKDFHSGEPRGFGFVQFLDPYDAEEAKHYMDRQIFKGREISVVFAEENRKRPDEMRVKERSRGRMSYGGHRRSPYRGRSLSRSPRYHSPSSRGERYSRYGSVSPSPDRSRSRSISPDARRKGREGSSAERSLSRSPKKGRTNVLSRRKGGRHSASPGRSSSPRPNGQAKSPVEKQRNSRSRSHSNDSERSSISVRKYSRSRSKSWRESRSPCSPSPPSGRRHSPFSRHSDYRNSSEPAEKSFPSVIRESRNEDDLQTLEKSK